MIRYALVLLLVLAAGCACVKEEAITTIKTTAAGNDRYTEVLDLALSGKSTLALHGVAAVSSNDLETTPPRVRALLQRLLETVHANRFSAHSTLFQLDEGPDPATLDLKPILVPAVPDKNADLLGDK